MKHEDLKEIDHALQVEAVEREISELKAVGNLVAGEKWASLARYLSHEESKVLHALAVCNSWEDTLRLQGRYAQLRDILRLKRCRERDIEGLKLKLAHLKRKEEASGP